MKSVFMGVVASVLTSVAVAAPEVGQMQVSLTSDGCAKVSYVVANEPGVVTFDATYADGTAVADADMTDVTGEVNCLVAADVKSIFRWKLPDAVAAVAKDVTITLRAWPTNCPPDYMVVCLSNLTDRVRYYPSVARFPVPFGDQLYKTTHLVMRKIPAAGVVWRMGSPDYEPGRTASAEGTRRVVLTHDYYLGVYPVTIGQYDYLRSLTGYPSSGQSTSITYLDQDNVGKRNMKMDWPRGQLSYTYLRGGSGTASGKEWDGVTPYWPIGGHAQIDSTSLIGLMRTKWGVSFDLPSEAEWEFACRAGTTSAYYTDVNPDGPPNAITNLAWMAVNSVGPNYTNATMTAYIPHSVGTLAPNAFGLYDMLGGIWEFCADWYAPISGGAELVVDPAGPDTWQTTADSNRAWICGYRVRRGGSYATTGGSCRAACRSGYAACYDAAGTPKYQQGFRLWAPAVSEK